VYMLGHDHIAGDDEVIALANPLQRGFEKLARMCGAEIGQPVITTESQEMEVTGLLVSDESPGHWGKDIPQ
jgi:hypothetical protein